MWSKTQKQLNDFLCIALKDRVRYFVTQYRKSHDQQGRACIIVDDREVLDMCTLKYNIVIWNKETLLKQHPEMSEKGESYSVNREAEEIVKEQGVFAEYHFFDSVTEYFNNPIEQSINSDNMIILILALLDRRIGKRTLKNINEKIQCKHAIVQYFYKLRCDAEGI